MSEYTYWMTDKGLARITELAEAGLTNRQMAKKIGVHVATFMRWQSSYPELLEAIRIGKEQTDLDVENALLKAAIGGSKTKEIRDSNEDADGIRKIKKETITKTTSPNVKACIHWLGNRQPDRWGSAQDININLESDKMADIMKQLVKETKPLEVEDDI